jgi:exodeoxyribonuclease VII small subunit
MHYNTRHAAGQTDLKNLWTLFNVRDFAYLFVKVLSFLCAFILMSKVKATPPKDYESALAELEKIIASMESGKLSLEDSLAAYQRGAELLTYCRDQLAQMEQKVQILENGALKPFFNSGTDE